jgi:hypothetical protein
MIKQPVITLGYHVEIVKSEMMSLEPFVRVSQRNYKRLAELKRTTGVDSMDKVMELLLDGRIHALTRDQTLSNFAQ